MARFDDSFSGCTALLLLFVGTRMVVASSGDCRAVFGHLPACTSAEPPLVEVLTRDHNPYRPDERARIQASGGVILTRGQRDGSTPYTDPIPFDLLDGRDTANDPPRVYDPTGVDNPRPGCCFTRSIGDSYAKTLGVLAEPEVSVRDLASLGPGQTAVVCMGSDGAFEFLSSREVVEMAIAHPDQPVKACRAVCAHSYRVGEEMQTKTDDTTIICVFLQPVNPPAAT